MLSIKNTMEIKEEFKDEAEQMPRKVIVKTLTTTKSVDRAFDFFANMKKMEMGCAIKSMEKSDDGWWTFNHSIAGKSKMKQTLSFECGIVDHIFIGGGLEWNVYVRVVPNQSGSTTSWIFIRPNRLDDDQFEDQLKMFDAEIDKWKMALENL
jgi:hypothetical protein